MKVSITNKLIKQGVSGNPWACPIAQAIAGKRGVLHGSATVSTAGAEYRNKRLQLFVAKMPDEGKEFIRAFDRGKKVGPLTLHFRFQRYSKPSK